MVNCDILRHVQCIIDRATLKNGRNYLLRSEVSKIRTASQHFLAVLA